VQAVKHKLFIVAMLLFMVPHVASAVGLGRINVLSALGQPFKAEIDLVNVQKQDQASLTAKLASPENYQKAKLQYNAALTSLRLSIDKRPNGTPFIRAFSTRAVAEPFLDLLIELQWSGGRIVREYSALLDPRSQSALLPRHANQWQQRLLPRPVQVNMSSSLVTPWGGLPLASNPMVCRWNRR
jgi:pilus assembly protein FimV